MNIMRFGNAPGTGDPVMGIKSFFKNKDEKLSGTLPKNSNKSQFQNNEVGFLFYRLTTKVRRAARSTESANGTLAVSL